MKNRKKTSCKSIGTTCGKFKFSLGQRSKTRSEIRHQIKKKRRNGRTKDPNAKRTNFLFSNKGNCSCGLKLYTQDFAPSGKPYSYYRCREKECKLRLNFKEVDQRIWKLYLEIAKNPKTLKEAVLEENFIDGKSKNELEALRKSLDMRLEEIGEEIRRLNISWRKGYMEEDEYNQAYTELEGEQNQASTELRRIVNTLGLPNEAEVVG